PSPHHVPLLRSQESSGRSNVTETNPLAFGSSDLDPMRSVDAFMPESAVVSPMTILGCHFMMVSTNLLSPSQNSARVPAASPLLILSTSCFASFLPADRK